MFLLSIAPEIFVYRSDIVGDNFTWLVDDVSCSNYYSHQIFFILSEAMQTKS